MLKFGKLFVKKNNNIKIISLMCEDRLILIELYEGKQHTFRINPYADARIRFNSRVRISDFI